MPEINQNFGYDVVLLTSTYQPPVTQQLTTLGYTINPTSASVISPQGETIAIRPKTFELMMLLITRYPQRVSKEEILNTVWHDVVVGEHVVFQSIREIRQVFTGQEPIKTVPRQGYGWTSEVTTVSTGSSQPDNNIQTHRISPLQKLLLAGSVLLVSVLILLQYMKPGSAPQPVSGSIIVLPVSNGVEGSDHAWVELGAMDQLINRLDSSSNHGVLHTDYVLDVMARAKAPLRDFDATDIRQIFTVSGASLVIELTLLGVPRDYQLLFILHRQHGSEQGVLFADSIPDALTEMADIISARTGMTLSAERDNYTSDFANELVANAVTAKHSNRIAQSEQFINAAIAADPDNLTAHRLLAALLVEQKQFDRADDVLTRALRQSQDSAGAQKERVRLLFWSSMNHLQQGDVATGTARLEQTRALAKEINDWLYLAYVEEINGLLAQSQQRFNDAEAHFQSALNYHEVLQCPYGQSSGLLNLSKLAFETGQHQQAQKLAEQTIALSSKRQLDSIHAEAVTWQQRIETQAH